MSMRTAVWISVFATACSANPPAGPIVDGEVPTTQGGDVTLQPQAPDTPWFHGQAGSGSPESDTQAPLHAPTEVRTARPWAGDRVDGGAMVANAAQTLLYVADTEEDSILIVNPTGFVVQRVPIGDEPTRVARVGEDLFVTLRGTGELVRLTARQGTVSEVDRVFLGAEPYDIAVSQEAERLYVTLSQQDTVIALDGPTLAEIGRWTVSGEPKWVTTSHDGGAERVWVGTARATRLREITVGTGALRTLPLGTIPRFQDPNCVNRTVAPRITGDLAIDAAGLLYVPVLFADTQLVEPPENLAHLQGFAGDTASPPPSGPAGVGVGCRDIPRGVAPGGYGVVSDGVHKPGRPGRLTPSIVQVDTTPSARPPRPLAFGANVEVGELHSYPGAVTVDGGDLLIPAPGSSVLVVARPGELVDGEDAGPLVPMQRRTLGTSAGPLQAVRFGPDLIAVWSFLERGVTLIDRARASGVLDPRAVVDRDAATRIDATPSSLSPDLQAGRRAFWSADDLRVSGLGSGVSCETCHADGRNDGLTWQFEDMVRQTPSLAGGVSDTAPFTWTGVVGTVKEEVELTSAHRMGGGGAVGVAEAIALYVDTLRAPIRPASNASAVARGQAIFRREDVGCVTCHEGTTFTDGQEWSVMGFTTPTNTPTLRGIGGSAPYLHDGSAPTVRAVLERARSGEMGNTADLTDAELSDLEAYLLSL